MIEPSERRRPPRRNVQRRRLIAGIVVLIVVFVLGIAFGKALNDNPKTGESTTFVRTWADFELMQLLLAEVESRALRFRSSRIEEWPGLYRFQLL